MNTAERQMLARAEEQYGVVARAQPVACGLSQAGVDRRIAGGRLDPLFPGVYRISGSVRTGRQRAMAAHLWLGPESLISHRTSGTLLHIDGMKTSELTMSVPRETRRRMSAEPILLHRTRVMDPIDRVRVDGLPCTSATRTLIDCSGDIDDEALEVAFESARRMGLTSPRALAARAAVLCGRGRPGSASIRRLLARQRPGEPALQYRLEVKTARLLRSSTLPRPVRQFPLGPFRLDFAYVVPRVGGAGVVGPVGEVCAREPVRRRQELLGGARAGHDGGAAIPGRAHDLGGEHPERGGHDVGRHVSERAPRGR
jgi:hypothetical protein